MRPPRPHFPWLAAITSGSKAELVPGANDRHGFESIPIYADRQWLEIRDFEFSEEVRYRP